MPLRITWIDLAKQQEAVARRWTHRAASSYTEHRRLVAGARAAIARSLGAMYRERKAGGEPLARDLVRKIKGRVLSDRREARE